MTSRHDNGAILLPARRRAPLMREGGAKSRRDLQRGREFIVRAPALLSVPIQYLRGDAS